MVSIRARGGRVAGQAFVIDTDKVLGRDAADITIDDEELSRRHLALRPGDGFLVIEDLGSTNGTFVDGRPIVTPVQLANGGRFTAGNIEFEVEGIPVSQPTRSAPVAAAPPAPAAGGTVAPVAVEPPPVAVPAAPPLSGVRRGPAPEPAPMGAFAPPTRSRGGGLASRSWVPVALSYGTVVATAIGLVVYFAERS